MDRYLHRCNHDAFYTHRNTLKHLDHPCLTCATCVTDRLYDPDPCEVCSKWLKNIKDNNVEAESSSSLWMKLNRSLVGYWKHNRTIPYNDPNIDMLIWADTEKFALWKPFLPAPNVRRKRQKSEASEKSLPATPSPVTTSLLPAGQGVAPQVTPGQGVAPQVTPDPLFSAPLPESGVQPIEATRDPSVGGSDWSGFPDDLEEPFPDLFSDLELAPPLAALNPGQKRACSPDPTGREEPVLPNTPVSMPPAVQSEFSAGQLATLKALIQSCLAPQTLPSPLSAPAPSLHAPILPPTPTSGTPRAGPSWFSGPPPPPAPPSGPSGVPPPQSFSPQPGPSWASDPPPAGEAVELTEGPEFVVLSDSEEGDADTPPVGRSRMDPLHLAAADALDRLWHETPADISPIPIPGITGHTESTIYYCGSRVHYQWHEEIPTLILFEGNSHIHLPVDQDFVRVFREGGHLAFSIAEPEESLHAIFRPFILAAVLIRPLTSRSPPSPRHQLRSIAALDLVHHRSSFTPMDPSKDKWVESDKALATKLLATVEDARKNANLRVQARPIPVLSSGTGFSQYFQGPLLSPTTEDTAHKDLFAIFQTRIPRYLILDEARERSAAHHYWSLLHPLQLARDLATVTDSTIFTVKPEGLRSLPLPTLLQGIQGAVSLTFDHLEDVCVRSLTKAVQAKVKIRELMLGAIKPHTLRDPLLHSDILHPEIFPSSALNAALPFFKTALDASSLRDHAGRLPSPQAPRSGMDQVFVPRGRRSRRGANRDPRSRPPTTLRGPQTSSEDLRGGVLSDLRRQVADLRAQIVTPAPNPHARLTGRGRGSVPPRDRAARRGRSFFRGNGGRSRGRASFNRRNNRSASDPSHQHRGSRGRRRH